LRILGRVICYSNRLVEESVLESLIDRFNHFPLIIYGPEGCGKTTLMRYLTRRLGSKNYTSLYINALEYNVAKALEFRGPVINSIIRDLLRDIGGPLPSILSNIVQLIVDKIWVKLKSLGNGLFIVIDDVYKAIGLENVDRYTKLVYEWISWKASEYTNKLLVVITTSEGASKRILVRHTYTRVSLIWNMDYGSYEEFIEQLEPRIRVDEAYSITGGNPRLTIELAEYSWDTKKLMSVYEEKIKKILQETSIKPSKLQSLVEDPDSEPKTARILEDAGLMIELYRTTSISQPKPSTELGIGKEWAWQTPLYKNIVQEYIKKP